MSNSRYAMTLIYLPLYTHSTTDQTFWEFSAHFFGFTLRIEQKTAT